MKFLLFHILALIGLFIVLLTLKAWTPTLELYIGSPYKRHSEAAVARRCDGL